VTEVDAGVWRSTDAGDTWQNVSGLIGADNVKVLALSPSFALDNVVLAGTRNRGLYRSNDRGDSWTRLLGVPGQWEKIDSIAISPDFANDETVYVISFYRGVLRSTDGGTNWQEVNVGLPVDVKRRIVISPEFVNDRTLYAATNAWIPPSPVDASKVIDRSGGLPYSIGIAAALVPTEDDYVYMSGLEPDFFAVSTRFWRNGGTLFA